MGPSLSFSLSVFHTASALSVFDYVCAYFIFITQTYPAARVFSFWSHTPSLLTTLLTYSAPLLCYPFFSNSLRVIWFFFFAFPTIHRSHFPSLHFLFCLTHVWCFILYHPVLYLLIFYSFFSRFHAEMLRRRHLPLLLQFISLTCKNLDWCPLV